MKREAANDWVARQMKTEPYTGPCTKEEWAKLLNTPWAIECRRVAGIMNSQWLDDMIFRGIVNEARRST